MLDLITKFNEEEAKIYYESDNHINCDKEIERLNNIINELEKYLNEQIQKSWEIEEQCYETILDKLQELKENK